MLAEEREGAYPVGGQLSETTGDFFGDEAPAAKEKEKVGKRPQERERDGSTDGYPMVQDLLGFLFSGPWSTVHAHAWPAVAHTQFSQ